MDVETRQLQQRLQAAQQLPEVLMLKPTTTSTNDDVREIAQKGIHSALVCSAQQTQGRGQRQRQWVSPEGNVYLSTLLNTRTAIDGRLALEVALNILHMPSLEALNLQIKWPNDLYSVQGKWGGILIEIIKLDTKTIKNQKFQIIWLKVRAPLLGAALFYLGNKSVTWGWKF